MSQQWPAVFVAGALVVAAGGGACQTAEAQSPDRAVEHGQSRQTERDSIQPAWSPGGAAFGARATGRDVLPSGGGADGVDFSRTVSQRRPAEGLRPEGGRVGAFVVRPALDVREIYDSNIFATETNAEGDFITVLNPSIQVQSDWARHSLGLTAEGRLGQYIDNPSENYEDAFVGASGRIDVTNGTTLTVNGSYQRGHVARSSPDDTTGSEEPKLFDRTNAYVELARALGLFVASADTAVTWTDFHDGETSTGAVIDNDPDNALLVVPGFRVGYVPAPGTEAYARFRYLDVTYPEEIAGGVSRDGWGVDALFGVTKVIDGLWSFGAYGGYAPRYFDDPAMDDIDGLSGLAGGLNVTWNPTAFTSAILDVTHSTAATTTAGASAIQTTRLGLTVQQELSRAVMIDATAGYTYGDYIGTSREDNTMTAGIGAEYLVNRWGSLNMAYDFTSRDSNRAGSSYDRHTFGFGFRIQY